LHTIPIKSSMNVGYADCSVVVLRVDVLVLVLIFRPGILLTSLVAC